MGKPATGSDLPVANGLDLVVFALDDHRYALVSDSVQEIVRAVAITRLPGAPEVVEGVIDLRGTVVPVLDPRRRFGLEESPLAPEQHFIVAHAGPRRVVLRVDRVIGLQKAASVDDATLVVPGVRHASGIARLANGLVLIHDLSRFLALDEATLLDAALAKADSRAGGEAP